MAARAHTGMRDLLLASLISSAGSTKVFWEQAPPEGFFRELNHCVTFWESFMKFCDCPGVRLGAWAGWRCARTRS